MSHNKELYDWYNELGEKAPLAELIEATPQYQWRIDFLRPYLEGWMGASLDLGCNEGRYKRYIKNYVGLDIAHSLLKKFRGDRVKADIRCLPFKDESFDHILLTEVLEHVHEHQQVINECARLLKKTGELLVTTPYGDDPFKSEDFFVLKRYGIERTRVLHGGFESSHFQKLFDEAGLYLESCDRFAPRRIHAYGFKR